MKLFTSIVASVLSICCGLVFIVSSVSKWPVLESFGWTIVENTWLNWTAAEWLARILVGAEFLIGVFFVAHIAVRKLAIPLSLLLLSVFSIYLIAVYRLYGPAGNCGCFGEWIPMTPLQSLVKNAILMALIFGVYFLKDYSFHFPYKRWVIVTLTLLCLLIPFLVLPPESIYIVEKDKSLHQALPLSLLYTSPNNTAPKVELRKGKHVIALLSLSCHFCRKAARRMHIMKLKHPELPFYFVLNGDPARLNDFFSETKANNIPYTLFNGAEQFTRLNNGYSVPSIKWVEDTTLVRQPSYMSLQEDEILAWMHP